LFIYLTIFVPISTDRSIAALLIVFGITLAVHLLKFNNTKILNKEVFQND